MMAGEKKKKTSLVENRNPFPKPRRCYSPTPRVSGFTVAVTLAAGLNPLAASTRSQKFGEGRKNRVSPKPAGLLHCRFREKRLVFLIFPPIPLLGFCFSRFRGKASSMPEEFTARTGIFLLLLSQRQKEKRRGCGVLLVEKQTPTKD